MTTIQVCRTCLAHDTRMYTIANLPLLLLYEKIINSTRNVEDVKPIVVCYICYHLLRKYHRFTESAVKAEHVLQEIRKNNIQITEEYITIIDKPILCRLQMSPVLSADIEPQDDENKKAEIKIEFDKDQITALGSTEDTYPEDTNQEDSNQEIPININIKTETVLKSSESEEDEVYQDPLHSLNFHYSLEFDDETPQPSVSIKKENVVAEMKSVPKKSDTESRTFDQHTKSQEILVEISSKEDIVAENTTNSINKSESIKLPAEDFVNGHKQSSINEKNKCKNVFACKFCDRTFTIKKCHKRHEMAHTGDRPFMCNHCGRKFMRSYHLSRHMRTHTGEKPFACSHCGKKFARKHSMVTHERTHTENPPKFDKPLTENTTLTEHETINTDETYKCNYCDKKYTKKCYLTRHEYIHTGNTGEKTFECDYCQKQFRQKSTLEIHIRLHTGEKPHTCEFCGEKFRKTDQIRVHKMTHQNEMPFKCNFCDKTFARAHHKRDHEMTHTGEKPFLCKLCGKKFNRQGHLKRHERGHTGEKPYTCSQCGKKFTVSCNLREHVRTQHTDEKFPKLIRKRKTQKLI
ncbi:hypothetical protein ABMA27_012623 [Loxostege sticticalis]|uniref:Uncharacterized protein n=1 Tax=Loxostege sticticalis TaxID=481309 RepID=A0ABR3GZE0_LOXSC